MQARFVAQSPTTRQAAARDIIETLRQHTFMQSHRFVVALGVSMLETIMGISVLMLPSMLTVAWLVWRAY
jgi:hypothetical protein